MYTNISPEELDALRKLVCKARKHFVEIAASNRMDTIVELIELQTLRETAGELCNYANELIDQHIK